MSTESNPRPKPAPNGVRKTAAIVLELAIASPGDAEPLHEHVRRAVDRWNRAHGIGRGIVLVTRSAKKDVAPEFANRVQDVPNRRLLPRCEILLAIFWTRVGTPSDRYESGTIEEIARHQAARKWVLVYFADLPVPPSRIDTDQLRQVAELREKWAQKAYVRQVSSVESLDDCLYRDVENLMNAEEFADLGPTAAETAGSGATAAAPRKAPDKEGMEKAKPEPIPSPLRMRCHCGAMEIERLATAHLIRLDACRSSDAREALDEFLNQSPRNRVAYFRMELAWKRMDGLRRLRPLDHAVDPDLLGPRGRAGWLRALIRWF